VAQTKPINNRIKIKIKHQYFSQFSTENGPKMEKILICNPGSKKFGQHYFNPSRAEGKNAYFYDGRKEEQKDQN
jgi:hypothetical protein